MAITTLEAAVFDGKKQLDDFFTETKAKQLSLAQYYKNYYPVVDKFDRTSKQLIASIAQQLASALGVTQVSVCEAIFSPPTSVQPLICIMEQLSSFADRS